jgi:hypothetical protein
MSERTITIKPGETIKIVCAGDAIPEADPFMTGGAKKSKKNKTRKAQSGGKKGPNGYMKFAAEMRPQILKEHPELKSDVVKVARKIGEKWRALSDSEKARY